MKPFDRVVAGGTLVLADGLVRADLGIRDGRIAAIADGLEGIDRVDARGLWVLPGVVDPHVHPIHAEEYGSVARAGLRGGVTTLLHHLYTPVNGDPIATLERGIAEAEALSPLDFAFHLRLADLTRTAPSIAPLVAGGAISFKLFMAYGARGVMVRDDELLRAFDAAGAAGGVVLIHAENGHAADWLEAQARASGAKGLADYYATRPDWVEAEAVGRALRLLRERPCRLYLVHLTCRASLEEVARAKLAGLDVIAETCPHYLLLTAEEAHGMGARAKMAPPLRTAADRDALWDALASGLLDTIGTDHSAFVREEKEASDDVFDAGFGVPGIGTMLPLLFDRGVRSGRLTPERLMALLALEPAKRLGLAGRKGGLSVGHDADLVLFDPDEAFTIDAASEGERAYYSLYEGWRGHGVVKGLLQRGRWLVRESEIVAPAAGGRYLPRRPVTPVGPSWATER